MHHPEQKQKIGDYVIGKTIDKNPLSQVKICRHTLTKQKVILKKIHKKKCQSSNDITYVMRELHALKILKHPNIIELFQITETQTSLMIYMQYAKKGSILNNLLKIGKYPEQQAKQYFWQLVSAISYMHQMGVAHRDLKLQNILLDEKDQIKVIDFGLSNIYAPKQSLFTPCGSPNYAAPQKILHKSYDPLKADLWSCGMVLYYLVVGHLPFSGSNIQELYKRIEKGVVQFPKHLSPSITKLLSGLLQKQANKRWSIQKIVECEWMNDQPYLTKGLDLRKNPLNINYNLLRKIETQFSINSIRIENSLLANKYDANTTLYKIMLKKQGKNTNNNENLESIKKDFLTDVEFLTPRKQLSIQHDGPHFSFNDMYYCEDFGYHEQSDEILIQNLKQSFFQNQFKQLKSQKSYISEKSQKSQKIKKIKQPQKSQNIQKLQKLQRIKISNRRQKSLRHSTLQRLQKTQGQQQQQKQQKRLRPSPSKLTNYTRLRKLKYKTQTNQSSSQSENKLKLDTLRRIYLNEENKRFGQIISWWKRVRQQIKWHQKKINFETHTSRKSKTKLNSTSKLKMLSTPKMQPKYLKGFESTNAQSETKTNLKYKHLKLPKIGPLFTDA